MAEKSGTVGSFYAQTGSATSISAGPVGTGNASQTVFYCIEVINSCDATTDWTGTSLSSETSDKKEGTGAVKDTIATPVATTEYITSYDPASTWDITDRTKLSFWFKCDRASTAFTHARLYIEDSSGNASYWNLTFSAAVWTRFDLSIHSPDGNNGTAATLSIITKIETNLEAADTTAFYVLIDWLGYTPNMAHAGLSVTVGGTTQTRELYSFTPSGALTFGTAPGSGSAVAVTYDHYAVSEAGGFFNWSVDNTCETLESTDFGDSGNRTYILGQKGWSGSAEAHWLNDDLHNWAGTEMIFKMYVDTSTTPKERYEGWGIVTSQSPTVDIGTIINETMSFQGTDALQFSIA